MGFYVHIHVCFECHGYDGIARLARKHLPTLPEEWANKDAVYFLRALSRLHGEAPGTKGGMCLWGHVGNYTDVGLFVKILEPFWRELLPEVKSESDLDDWDGPFAWEHVLVFYQPEDRDHAAAYEIYWDDPDAGPQKTLICRHHERLPFKW